MFDSLIGGAFFPLDFTVVITCTSAAVELDSEERTDTGLLDALLLAGFLVFFFLETLKGRNRFK